MSAAEYTHRPRRTFHLVGSLVGLAMLAMTTLVFAGPSTGAAESTAIPVALTVWVPCALDGGGELVSLEGQLHVIAHTVQRSSTTWITVSGVNPQGVVGTGHVSGDIYRGTGHTGARTVSTAAGERISQTNSFGLIGPGPGNNLLAHANWHITVLQDGSIVGQVDNVSLECR